MTDRTSAHLALLSLTSCYAISFVGLHAFTGGPSSPYLDPFVLVAFALMAGASFMAPTYGNVLGLGFTAGTVGAIGVLLIRFLTGLEGIGVGEALLLTLPFLFKGVLYAGPVYVAAFTAKAMVRICMRV